MSDMNKYYVIYRVTNKLNSRFYIGMHTTNNPNDGYLGSGKRIKAEVKKYGKDNFVKEILEYLPNREALANREKEIVNEELLQNPLCLNLKNGGEGGNIYNPNQDYKVWGNSGRKIIQYKLSNDIEFRGNYSEKISKGLLKSYKFGLRKSAGAFAEQQKEMSIRAQTCSAKEKRKTTMKERGHMQGNKNSQFGIKRIGINKDGKIKKVLVSELQYFLDEGWSKGFNAGVA
jgi:hypothetical protein